MESTGVKLTRGFAPLFRLTAGEGQSGEVLARSLLDRVVKEYHALAREDPTMAVATIAIKALTSLITQSNATTMMGLEKEIKEAAAALQKGNPSSISLKAGCDLFLRYTTRTSELENANFDVTRRLLIERGNKFAETSSNARRLIADIGSRFIRENAVILCHGYSRVVLELLQLASKRGCHFKVLLTEGRPSEAGLRMARDLRQLVQAGISVTVILDGAAAYYMDTVDMVLVGAEAVVESGGIINCLGTYQIALCAHALRKHVYVAAESYKFARLFPLSQRDIPREDADKTSEIAPLLPKGVQMDSPSRDYTPPAFINLLLTDFGALTPAAVSDELIQLYI